MTTYVMEAKENYPAAYAADFAGNTTPFDNQTVYQHGPGGTYDKNRQVLTYNASIYNFNDDTNNTGHVLWSGQNLIDPLGAIVPASQKNLQICTKSVDSELVTFYNCYDATKTVPVGVQGIVGAISAGGTGYTPGIYLGVPLTGGAGTGASACVLVYSDGTVQQVQQISGASGYTVGDVLSASNTHLGGSGSGFTFTLSAVTADSDGTWRRFVESATISGLNARPQLVDPRTGNVWDHVDSFAANFVCTVYCLRFADSYAQVISPLLPVDGSAHMEPIGISDNWTYIIEETNSGATTVPFHIALTPRVFDAAETANDFLLTYGYFTLPSDFLDMTVINAFTFTQNQTVYFVHVAQPGAFTSVTARAYSLWLFAEPTSAPFGGPVVGGGFSDVTPWTSTTGPNTNAAAYVYNPSIPTTSYRVTTTDLIYYLPATNQLAQVSKFMSWQTSGAPVDPALTFFDCTYVDISGSTFDYHNAFVTGYMNADWTPGSSGTAAYVVLDVYEGNLILKQNSYVFAGVDYTKRWFTFVVQKYTGGTFAVSQPDWHYVFVEYQFVYGTAPVVVQVIDEDGWDTAYASYGTTIGNTNVVYQSAGLLKDRELYDSFVVVGDDASPVFWFSGDNSNIYHLDSTFTNRLSLSGVSGPFLRLTSSAIPPPPTFANSFVRSFVGNPQL